MNTVKSIRLSDHARDQLRRRGGTDQEVTEAIRTSAWKSAQKGRFACDRDFPYNTAWNNRTYACKRVRPVFVDKSGEIVVVTVYVYFF